MRENNVQRRESNPLFESEANLNAEGNSNRATNWQKGGVLQRSGRGDIKQRNPFQINREEDS
jgi:hypothetical protein